MVPRKRELSKLSSGLGRKDVLALAVRGQVIATGGNYRTTSKDALAYGMVSCKHTQHGLLTRSTRDDIALDTTAA